MDKPTKFVVTGAVIGCFVIAGGYVLSLFDDAKVADLVEICESGKRIAKQGLSAQDKLDFLARQYREVAEQGARANERPWADDPIVAAPSCDPKQINYKSSGIYRQIYEADKDARQKIETAWTIAGFLLFISCIPYAWYFCLRRLREVASAITGRSN